MRNYAICLSCLFLLALTVQPGNVQAAEPTPPSSLTPPPQSPKQSKFFPSFNEDTGKAAESTPPPALMLPSSRQVQSENAQAAEQNLPDSATMQKNITAIQKSAARGDARSQFRMGLMYEFGIGVSENKKLAAIWYGKAAKQEHGRAQEMLSKLVQTERDIKQSEAGTNRPANKPMFFPKENENNNPGALPLNKTSPNHL